MNVRALIPLIAGLGIGGLALKLGFDYVKRAQGAQKPAEMVKVWAAAQDIARGKRITEEMLKPMGFPPKSMPEGAFREKDKLVGRVVRMVSPGGLPILESMLAPPGSSPGLLVKKGFRAVPVSVNARSGQSTHLEPGSYVDVIASFKVRRDRGQETITRTIVQNCEVAAVGERLSPVVEEEEDGGRRRRSSSARSVWLYVRPDEAMRLALAEEKGKITLALRGQSDPEAIDDQTIVSGLELTGDVVEEEGPSKSVIEVIRELIFGPEETPEASEPEPDPEPEVKPLAPTGEEWVVVLHLGDDVETLRFKNRDSYELVDDVMPATAPDTAPVSDNALIPTRMTTPPTNHGRPMSAVPGDNAAAVENEPTEDDEPTEPKEEPLE